MSTIKLLNIVGARPQIIKSSAISRAIRTGFSDRITGLTVHTGQHYDKELSDVFFDELEIPMPDFNLGVGSARHGRQTAAMIAGIEDVLIEQKPDGVLLYGDTNSTLAGAVAASKQRFPIVHIEAGLRSFNKTMPEEINRIMCDHVSTLLFAPTNAAFKNLMHEGFSPENSPPYTIDNPKIYITGDIMYDNSLYYAEMAERKKAGLLESLEIERNNFVLATIHRDINTDDAGRLERIMSTVKALAEDYRIPFVIPFHPRTMKSLKSGLVSLLADLRKSRYIRIIPPVSYLTMTFLEKNCLMIMTDSGGVQKESHFFRKPCIVLRKETEWIELVTNGTVILADADPALIHQAFEGFVQPDINLDYPGFYGDGKTSEFILREILMLFEN